MSKGGKTTTSTVTPDAQTQAAREAIYNRGTNLADSPEYQNLLKSYSGFGGLQSQGVAALTGDPEAFSKFMNPYLDQVLKRIGLSYDQAGASALTGVNDRFTRAGAFGGSRAALASGVAAAQNARDRADAQSQYIYRGFNDAQARALSAANLGLSGNADYLRAYGAPANLWSLAEQNGGTTSTTKQPGGSLLGQLAGAATTVGGFLMGGPPGAAAASMVANDFGLQPPEQLSYRNSPLQLR